MVPTPFEYVRAEEHLLPYRVIFEELLATGAGSRSYGGHTFLEIVQEAFRNDAALKTAPGQKGVLTSLVEATALLFEHITAVEDYYRLLALLKDQRRYAPSEESALSRLEAPLLEILHRVERTAICLSGGGIRSAALSLGVLQMLSRFRNAKPGAHYDDLELTSALEEFDYLSTVSGGGYIGSWLAGWTHRVDKAACDAAAKAKQPLPAPGEAYHQVVRSLAGDVRHTSADPAQRPVRHLREYTSFLAPKLGFTLDSFTLAAIVLRNLFVNWLMILPILFTLACGLQLLRVAQFSHVGLLPAVPNSNIWWGLAVVCFLAAGITAGRRMPSSMPPLPVAAATTQGERRVLLLFVLPLFLASQVLIRLWFNLGMGWGAAREDLLLRMTAVSFIGLLSIPTVRVFRQVRRHRQGDPSGVRSRPVAYAFAGLAAAAFVSALLSLALYSAGATAARALDARAQVQAGNAATHAHAALAQGGSYFAQMVSFNGLHLSTDRHFTDWAAVLAFPVVWLLIMLASSLFSALLGAFEEDVDREWWARAGGLMMSVLVLWVVGIALVLVAPHFVLRTRGLLGGVTLAGIVGLLGALGGASTAGTAAEKQANVSAVGRFLTKHDLLLPLLCGVALLIAATVVAAAESALARRIDGARPLEVHLALLLGFGVVSLLVNAVVNINIFSLHGMYRMRLMRAFLGASNLQRLPNAFTGFDDTDNIEEAAIRTGEGVPLHVVNATVNLVGTSNSAWRQRKAEGFTISPLHSGGWRLGYTRTGAYGGQRGLTLATAMAISGAAFNPNMGYHSSALVTLVMTLFNVRLGWWLPNPKYRSAAVRRAANRQNMQADLQPDEPAGEPPAAGWMAQPAPSRAPDLAPSFLRRRSPGLALWPLLEEAFGGTNDEGKYIELTDGGHFENLGLYEMVMRRVQWIVVIDGSADPQCQLEDLGNAMRKIEIDLGIPIIFKDGPPRMKAGLKNGNLYCAVAEIRYGITDYVQEPSLGHLLYIKAGLNGQEPPDVLQYARTHSTFPHESTANQFFTESQFESYRHLGTHEVSSLLRHVDLTAPAPHKPLVRALFDAAATYMATPPPKRRAAVPPVAGTPAH